MLKIQSARGMHDIYGDEAIVFEEIIRHAKQVANKYNFHPLYLPVVEMTELYSRGLGDETDVVSKEMYVFQDRNGTSLALRPEFTAGVARFLAEHGDVSSRAMPQKFFSFGALFRHERPQKGRYRQFNQVNFEIIGAESVMMDLVAVLAAVDFLSSLGLRSGEDYELTVNFLSDKTTRERYRAELVKFFENKRDCLSEDSQKRLEVNPLRILDSKDEGDKELVRNAPPISNFYSDEYKQEIGLFSSLAKQAGIEFVVDQLMVRGLDYYDGLVFECISNKIGTQAAILGGGRYSRLLKEVGAPDISSVGFAAGVERLALIDSVRKRFLQTKPLCLGIIHNENDALLFALKVLKAAHLGGFMCELSDVGGNISKKIKKMVALGCTHIVVCGNEELMSNLIKVKCLATGVETEILLTEDVLLNGIVV